MKLERAREIVEKFAQQRVLVIGDVVLDRYVFGKVERLNPEAPVPILHAHSEKLMTGGAGNTAKNAAMLGAKTTLISVVGTDHPADDVRQAAQVEGYTAELIADDSQPTIVKIRYLVHSQQLLRVDYEETADSDSAIEQQVLEALTKAAPDYDGILVSDYAKGVITPQVAEAVMHIMREQHIPVMADVKPSRITYFTGVTYISPNRKEAHEFLGLNQHDHGGRSAEELAAMLHETFESTVFLTLSEQGMQVQAAQTPGVAVPQSFAKADEVVDTSGCGDTAATTILLAKLSGATDAEAAELANAAGAVVARKIGSVGSTPDELLHIIEHYGA